MVIGPLPTANNFGLALEYTNVVGVNASQIGSYSSSSMSMMFETPNHADFISGVLIEASSCFGATYCMHSNNPVDDQTAGLDDTITVTVTSDGPIATPTVVCNGITFSVVTGSDGDTEFTAVYTVQAGDAQGPLTCTVTFDDLTGSPGVEATLESPQSECSVTIGECEIENDVAQHTHTGGGC